jgi:NAD(P)-dependent dehydrogenase (short-subunit alcohol dehydrogenase family)
VARGGEFTGLRWRLRPASGGENSGLRTPGATATELAKKALGEEGQKVFASMTPLQRMADPAEIGAVVAFLASSDSSFMTASEVAVDGGLAQL